MNDRLPAPRALLPLLVLGALLWAVEPALAGDPRTGRIDIEARLEPQDLGPGQGGLLVLEGTLLPKLHIYATGEQAMQYTPVEAEGVTYHMDTLQFTDPHAWKDEVGDAYDVWEESFVFKVKVTLAEDVAPGTKLGMRFTYFGCNDRGCYPVVKDHAATITLPGAAPAGPRIVQGPLHDEGSAALSIDEEKGEAVVTFTPTFGWHMYGPGATDGEPVKVTPKAAEGVTWGQPVYPPAELIENTSYAVRIPFQRAPAATEIVVEARWVACEAGPAATCAPPRTVELKAVWSAPGEAAPATPQVPEVDVGAPPAAPAGSIRFPVVQEAEPTDEGPENLFIRLGLFFVIGLGLAFTPCVLPIIPITVSVISGGKADIPKRRLAALLLTYVLGLSLAFATMGVVAALAGGSMSTLFSIPAVQVGIAILFLLLAFAMLGIYELQPPAWMMNLQGGAQKHSGSFVGAFLFGVLGAVIASPCTGPAIAGLLIETAKQGNVVVGFLLFMTLGLGMGAVFFAAGSLNFALKPGPWMVWVRYVFGAILVGAALYYLASGALIGQRTLFIGGFGLAILSWYLVARHLIKNEGEEKGPARVRGAQVAVLLIVVTGLVGFITRRPSDLLEWTYARDPDHMVELVAEATAQGKPAVVDFWGTWCYYCKKYDSVIAATPELRQRFEQVARIKVDLPEGDERWDMRHAVGLKTGGAPHLIFLDRRGRIVRKLDVTGWIPPEELKKRIDGVLSSAAMETSSR